MRFTLTIEGDSAALTDGGQYAVVNLVDKAITALASGQCEGQLLDDDGNRAGSWRYEPAPGGSPWVGPT